MRYRLVLHCSACDGWTVRTGTAADLTPVYPGTNSYTSPCGHCGQDAGLAQAALLEQPQDDKS